MAKIDELISAEYLALNQELHQQPRKFGQSGRKHAGEVIAVAAALKINDLLDYGCGCGTLAEAMRKQDWLGSIREYDPAVPGREKLPKSAMLVVCTDVLEHIEPDRLEAVLKHLFELTRHTAYFAISVVESNKSLRDGRNAHLIVERPDWWISRVQRQGFAVRSRFLKFNDAGEVADVVLWLGVNR